MKRLPLVATVIVGLAVATMIALGVWQLDRRGQKEALIAQFAANQSRPSIAFPAIPMGDELLFRRASAFCLEPVRETIAAGYNLKGERGWRHLVACRTGAEGPGFTVDIGWSVGFEVRSKWKGGAVDGVIGPMPDQRSVIERSVADKAQQPLLLVATRGGGGLQPSAPPSLEGVPNNHLAYAVQWFLFAGIALGIYGLALWRRQRK
ncbi:MAG: SURF1 family protein [Pseudomonadota bacterium]